MRTAEFAPILIAAVFLGCASAPAKKTVYVLDGDETARTENGPIVVHEIPFWGKAADENTVVAASPESKALLEAVLRATPPAVRTSVVTFDEFAAQFVRKEKDPQVVAVRDELRDHAAVVVAHKRQRGGFWSRLFGG